MHPTEKIAVSARWIANRIARGVRNKPDISVDRLAQTRDKLESWIPGAMKRTGEQLAPSKADYPGRRRALGILNKYIGKSVSSDGSQLPQMVRNIGGFPINPSSRLSPHFDAGSRKIQPGGSWSSALHEYGHAMDSVARPEAFQPMTFGRYGNEVMANRNASKARATLQQEGVTVPGSQRLHSELKPAIESYRLNELQKIFSPMGGRNATHTYSPVYRAQKAMWDKLVSPQIYRDGQVHGDLVDVMANWQDRIRPQLSPNRSKIPLLSDLRSGWRVG